MTEFGPWRVTVENPYLGTDDEYAALKIEAAAGQAEDLTGVKADVILADLESEESWEHTDPETGVEVTVRKEVS